MSTVQYHEEDNGVLRLTLNRPDVHNAFDSELICCLTDTLAKVAPNPEIRVVVISGAGESFSAGADLNWMRGMSNASAHDNEHDALLLARMLRVLNYLPKPTVAHVNGSAYGGGLGLISACDIAVASEQAKFALTECRLGLAPAVISPYVLRRIGEAHCRRYFLSGERFDAEHAVRMGLIHESVPSDQLPARVNELCQALLKSGPMAAENCKKLIFNAAGHNADRQLQMDQNNARLIAGLRISAEGQEGMQAFLQKRPAAWRNTD